MADRYKNKYRIPSARWSEWDYGSNAAYFVTICTAHRERFFGEIVQGEMQLSEIGLIAQEYWLRIPSHFPFVVLDAFVIMPNHVHGIIVINKHDGGDGGDATGGCNAGGCDGRDAKFCVSTGGNATSTPTPWGATPQGPTPTGRKTDSGRNRAIWRQSFVDINLR